jgi:hypothetical protein
VWSTATITPLERPGELADKPFFTEEEVRAYEEDTRARTNRDRRDGGAAADVARAYNDVWWDSGTRVVPTRRTSLVIDPPDGRVPPVTAAAEQRQAAAASARAQRGQADNPEDRNLWERCITRGVPGVMLPQVYNNHYEIIQTRDHVVILAEMIHDARIIPIDGRPHLPDQLRFWMGDPIGRWEGDTLVVDVKGFNDQTWFDRAGTHHSTQLHVVERYKLTSPHHIQYEATIEDPEVFTRPWKISLPLYRRIERDARLMDFKCVEFVEELMFGEFRRQPLPRQ